MVARKSTRLFQVFLAGTQQQPQLGGIFPVHPFEQLKDFAAGVRNFFGGRSAAYEEELLAARQQALDELEQRAAEAGANAVVGVDIDYEVLGADNGMLMVTASGTAVIFE